jgi:3-hydroxyisobutyrate dehydrogenase
VDTVGFVGLGNMGSALAANLAATGLRIVTNDLAGPGRSPDGATFVDDLAALAADADVVVLSLPDGDASEAVVQELLDAPSRRFTHVVDTSTTGVDAARRVAALLADAGVGFVDAPVSGGIAGARARTLIVMFAGADDACDRVAPVLAGLSDRRQHVGDRAGLAQALKLANNFLSAAALAAASEAIVFGTAAGLSMDTMLDVINVASGRSAATSDKFVDHVLTGRYASGFANSLMAKDVQLYLRAAEAEGAPTTLGAVTSALWTRFAETEPDADFTRIYPFVQGS